MGSECIGSDALVNVLFAILCIINPEVDMTDTRLKWLMVSVCYLPVILWISSSRKQRTAHIDRIATKRLCSTWASMHCSSYPYSHS